MTRRNDIISYILTGIFAAFMLFDGVIHVLRIQPVVDSAGVLGYPVHTMLWIGLFELVAVALYLLPRTAVFGAVLLTGYLGGAIASQVRIEALGPVLFALTMALLMWGGLWLRSARLRALVPVRRPVAAAEASARIEGREASA